MPFHPALPDWIRHHSPPEQWTNVFSLPHVHTDRLYATETLFGEWGGRTLLLAKDTAPTKEITRWEHAERELGDKGGWKTNQWLKEHADSIPGGKLYGSATANLTYNGEGWSRSLPGFYAGPLQDYLTRVLRWVLESMPNVEVVGCLGAEAWFLTTTVLGHPGAARSLREHRNAARSIEGEHAGKRITAFALYHPAARVSNTAKMAAWSAMTRGAAAPST